MTDAASDYHRLTGFLATDPDNPALIADCAMAALAAGQDADATALVERHRALAGESPLTHHVAGLAAMVRREWAKAAPAFQALVDDGVNDPGIRYNLALCRAMSGDKDAAVRLLDDAVTDDLPQAAELRVGLLHERGELDAAEAVARAAVARFPDHRGLNAAVSTLAIDLDDPVLAQATAGRAGDHPDAQVTLATLAMDRDDAAAADALFAAALERAPDNARARVGRGLVALGRGDPTAADDLDRGAERFGDHLGSWIAAGWAHVLNDDQARARDRFARALAIDDSFAEAHGSLAVLDILAGQVEDGGRRADIALRLDRQSFSAALATALIAAGAGDATKAKRIVELALTTPLDDAGRTIGQALARMSARG